MSMKKSYDNVTTQLIDLAAEKKIPIAWDRLEEQSPQCGFGTMGVCCRMCVSGPC